MPVFDRAWLARQDYLDVESYAAVLGIAARFLHRPIPDQANLADHFPAASALA